MSSEYVMTALKELLQPVNRPETVEADKTYHILGAHWYAEGLYIKDTKPGSGIQADKVYRVEEGDFVYNRLFAWKGSFAVATYDNHNCYVSNEFPAFKLDRTQIDAKYLWKYFSRETAWNEALGLSSGGTPTSRNRLKEEKLLAMEIPLPPLEEQRRIVARIEELAAKIEEARGVQKQIHTDLDMLCRSIFFDAAKKEPVATSMRDLVNLREPDVSVNPEETYHFAGIYSFGRGMFKGNRRSGTDFSYTKLTRLKTDEFVYPKLMAWEGALALVPSECDGLVVSPEFPVFEINQDRVLPETLDVYFKSSNVWPLLSSASTGTNVRRKRLNPSDFLAFKMPLPSMETQLLLREVRRRASVIIQKQTETTAELDALLPSILDKAFKGEL